MMSFNVAPFHLIYDLEHTGAVQRHNLNIYELEYFSFMRMTDYPSKLTKVVLPWSLVFMATPAAFFGVLQ